jgi:hypothetical protein
MADEVSGNDRTIEPRVAKDRVANDGPGIFQPSKGGIERELSIESRDPGRDARIQRIRSDGFPAALGLTPEQRAAVEWKAGLLTAIEMVGSATGENSFIKKNPKLNSKKYFDNVVEGIASNPSFVEEQVRIFNDPKLRSAEETRVINTLAAPGKADEVKLGEKGLPMVEANLPKVNKGGPER